MCSNPPKPTRGLATAYLPFAINAPGGEWRGGKARTRGGEEGKGGEKGNGDERGKGGRWGIAHWLLGG